jgi:hypothetical protein
LKNYLIRSVLIKLLWRRILGGQKKNKKKKINRNKKKRKEMKKYIYIYIYIYIDHMESECLYIIHDKVQRLDLNI